MYTLPSLLSGSAVAFDYRLWHRGGANNSEADRPMLYAIVGRPVWKEGAGGERLKGLPVLDRGSEYSLFSGSSGGRRGGRSGGRGGGRGGGRRVAGRKRTGDEGGKGGEEGKGGSEGGGAEEEEDDRVKVPAAASYPVGAAVPKAFTLVYDVGGEEEGGGGEEKGQEGGGGGSSSSGSSSSSGGGGGSAEVCKSDGVREEAVEAVVVLEHGSAQDEESGDRPLTKKHKTTKKND